MAKFGIPYMGSKDKIAEEIIKIFPSAENFYDLFGGGFAITHATLKKRPRDFKNFHFNELRPGICDLIQKAIAGEFSYERFKPQFISREMFFANINDPYVKMIWSFGNDGKSYLFSKEIEPYKRSMHNAIVFNEFEDLATETLGMNKFKEGFSIKDKRLFLTNRIEFLRKKKLPECLLPFIKDLKNIDNLQRLQQLQQLQQLERLQRLEQTRKVEFYNLSYEQVPIKPNSIIYCDPPYADTKDYGSEFNSAKFFEWAASHSAPIFISEYKIKDSRFTVVKRIKKRSMLSATKDNCIDKEERVYANAPAMRAIMELKRSARVMEQREGLAYA